MSARTRKRRALLLLAVAIGCGGVAAAEVNGRISAVDSKVGDPVAVVVATRDVGPGKRLERGDVAMREVPGRFAPPDGLAAPADAVGLKTSGALARGAYVTAATLGGTGEAPGAGPAPLRRGERAVEVSVAGGEGMAGAGPGTRVDVLVSTDPGQGSGRTLLALEGVELLGLRRGGVEMRETEEADGSTGTSVATLRVGVRQAVYLAAAENYAKEVRLLARPAGDRGRGGRAAVGADGL